MINTHDVDLPDDQYIKTVGVWDFWIFRNDFPFLLPCLFGALISGNALIWTLYQVKNENQAKLRKLLTSSLDPQASMGYTKGQKDIDLDSDLYAISLLKEENSKSDICIFDNAVSIYQTNNSCSLPILNEGFFYGNKQRTPLLMKMSEFDKFEENEDEEMEIHSLRQLIKETDLIKTLLCYVIIAICVMMFREMNPGNICI